MIKSIISIPSIIQLNSISIFPFYFSVLRKIMQMQGYDQFCYFSKKDREKLDYLNTHPMNSSGNPHNYHNENIVDRNYTCSNPVSILNFFYPSINETNGKKVYDGRGEKVSVHRLNDIL